MISTYLQLNLWIAASWVLFHCLPSYKISFRHQRMTAQILLLMSIAMPVAISLLPNSLFPKSQSALLIDSTNSLDIAPQATPVSNFVSQTTSTLQASEFHQPGFAGVSMLGFIFFIGLIAMFAVRGKQWLDLRLLLSQCIEIRRVGKIAILISEAVDTPFSGLTWRKAFVVLPASIIGQQQDFKIALRHELQHHRCRDTVWAQLIELLACLFYLNPAIYGWRKSILKLQELACDEALISQMRISAQAYGHCLLRVAKTALETRVVYAGTTCMIPSFKTGSHSFLKRRIQMFSHHERSTSKKAAALVVGTFCGISITVAAFAAQTVLRQNTIVNPGKAEYDEQIQQIATEALRQGISAKKASAGFAIVSDPASGAIVAAVSINYGFNAALKDNWALSYPMAPASALKPLILASAIQNKNTSAVEIFDTGAGEYKVDDLVTRDYKSLNKITATEAVLLSSNIAIVKIAERMGSKNLESALRKFGIGDRDTIGDFPAASAGNLPIASSNSDKKYVSLVSQGHSDRMGFYVTPLEIVQAYGAIANGGRLMQARTINNMHESELVREVLSPDIAKQMRAILRKAVTDGTGNTIRESSIELAGKTSSAILKSGQRVGGFVGFAPFEDPKLVVYVAIFDPKVGHTGGSETAAPVFRAIIEKAIPAWSKRL